MKKYLNESNPQTGDFCITKRNELYQHIGQAQPTVNRYKKGGDLQ